MTTIELTKDDFGDTVSLPGTVLVDFWAAWCGPCRRFTPVFEDAAEEATPTSRSARSTPRPRWSWRSEFGISSIPTLMVVRDGVVVYAQPGALPAPALAELIGKVRELDMDEVREKVQRGRGEPGGLTVALRELAGPRGMVVSLQPLCWGIVGVGVNPECCPRACAYREALVRPSVRCGHGGHRRGRLRFPHRGAVRRR